MSNTRKIVIKVGTSCLTNQTLKLSRKCMLEIARQIAKLHENNHQIILVSSGSVVAGREVLNDPPRTSRSVPEKQMFSSVGQVWLMHIWRELFTIFDLPVGQLMLTRGDFSVRERYLNARNTLESLVNQGVIPIINENDSVATKEIEFGDNDLLSALVSNLVGADLLILLTDKEGLYTSNPEKDPEAQLVPLVEKIDTTILQYAGSCTKTRGMGSGGMTTKLEAAKLATQCGVETIIANSSQPDIILNLLKGENLGTRFLPQTSQVESRKRWLLSEAPKGTVVIDQGATEKLSQQGSSLLPIGIISTEGEFQRGETISICSPDHNPIAMGVANYSYNEVEQILGSHSADISSILGYSYGPEVVHRDNLTLILSQKT